MSPTLAKAATVSAVLALTLGVAPALAGDPRPGPATPQAQAAPVARAPATAAVRATYERMDALARSLFWTEEMEINPADPVAGPRAAQALRELGRYDQAAETASKTLVTQPANFDALLELGDDRLGRLHGFGPGRLIGRIEEDFAKPVLGLLGRGAQAGELVVDLILRNADTVAIETAHQAVPGDVGAHLLFEAGRVHARGDELLAEGLAGDACIAGHVLLRPRARMLRGCHGLLPVRD